MGYFRRHKLSDYSQKECEEAMRKIELRITMGGRFQKRVVLRSFLEDWAAMRELLARHMGENDSTLDAEEK